MLPMMEKAWVAKPNRVVKAQTPEELGSRDFIVDPYSLINLWGKDAPTRYMKARGMSDKAIEEMNIHHKNTTPALIR
jgi:hypothetical protein